MLRIAVSVAIVGSGKKGLAAHLTRCVYGGENRVDDVTLAAPDTALPCIGRLVFGVHVADTDTEKGCRSDIREVTGQRFAPNLGAAIDASRSRLHAHIYQPPGVRQVAVAAFDECLVGFFGFPTRTDTAIS